MTALALLGDEDSARLRARCDEFLELRNLHGRATILLLQAKERTWSLTA